MLKKYEIIKKELELIFNENILERNPEDVMAEMKEVIYNNVDYAELINFEEFIMTSIGGFVIFYRYGDININYTPFAIKVKEKYKKEKHDIEVVNEIYNWLKRDDMLPFKDMWALVKFKNKNKVVHFNIPDECIESGFHMAEIMDIVDEGLIDIFY